MGAKISFDYEQPKNPRFSEDEKSLTPEIFYCKETSSEVLLKLIPKYHIIRYNSIKLNFSFPNRIEISGHGSSFLFPGTVKINGLIIKPYEANNGLSIIGLVNDYSPKMIFDSYKEGNPAIAQRDIVIRQLIVNYLIDPEVLFREKLEAGKASSQKQSTANYLEQRKYKPNITKEKHLEDILVYGKGLFGDAFSEDYINEIIVNEEIPYLSKVISNMDKINWKELPIFANNYKSI